MFVLLYINAIDPTYVMSPSLPVDTWSDHMLYEQGYCPDSQYI